MDGFRWLKKTTDAKGALIVLLFILLFVFQSVNDANLIHSLDYWRVCVCVFGL